MSVTSTMMMFMHTRPSLAKILGASLPIVQTAAPVGGRRVGARAVLTQVLGARDAVVLARAPHRRMHAALDIVTAVLGARVLVITSQHIAADALAGLAFVGLGALLAVFTRLAVGELDVVFARTIGVAQVAGVVAVCMQSLWVH